MAVSPAEARRRPAAEAVGPEDRRRFRAALSATLAKDVTDRTLFEEAFESFFRAPGRPGREGKGTGGVGALAGSRVGGAGAGGAASAPARSEEPHAPGPQRVSTSAAPRRPGLRPLRPGEIQKELEKARARPTGAVPGARRGAAPRPPGGAPLKDTAPTGARAREKDDIVRERARFPRILVADRDADLASKDGGPARDARRRDLRAPATTEEERRLALEAIRIVEEIRLGRARRMRRAPRGRLFMKRLIRENLASGGVPFKIPRQSRRPKRPHLVLLVDVSWSVARAAGLFLLMVHGFLRSFRRVSVFFFVDRPVDATDLARRWLDGDSHDRHRDRSLDRSSEQRGARASAEGRGWSPYGAVVRGRSSGGARPPRRGPPPGAGVSRPGTGRSFLDAMSDLPGLDLHAASDYGRAFYALASGPLRGRRGDTVIAILGDGRTNVFDPLPWAFEEIASRARLVLWLAPEPRALWGTGDSAIAAYLPFCDLVIEATDLDGLAHGVRAIVSSGGSP